MAFNPYYGYTPNQYGKNIPTTCPKSGAIPNW